MTRFSHLKRIISTTLISGWVLTNTLLCGCGGPLDRNFSLDDLSDPSPTVRIMAVKWAGDNKKQEAIPFLVDNLQNEDRSIRFYSIGALIRITDTDCGYDYKASPTVQKQAIECWQNFLISNETETNEN
jgi:hypothetical protein